MEKKETHEPNETSGPNDDRSTPEAAEPEVVADAPDTAADELVTQVVTLDGDATPDPLSEVFEEDDDVDGDDFDEDDFDEDDVFDDDDDFDDDDGDDDGEDDGEDDDFNEDDEDDD